MPRARRAETTSSARNSPPIFDTRTLRTHRSAVPIEEAELVARGETLVENDRTSERLGDLAELRVGLAISGSSTPTNDLPRCPKCISGYVDIRPQVVGVNTHSKIGVRRIEECELPCVSFEIARQFHLEISRSPGADRRGPLRRKPPRWSRRAPQCSERARQDGQRQQRLDCLARDLGEQIEQSELDGAPGRRVGVDGIGSAWSSTFGVNRGPPCPAVTTRGSRRRTREPTRWSRR